MYILSSNPCLYLRRHNGQLIHLQNNKARLRQNSCGELRVINRRLHARPCTTHHRTCRSIPSGSVIHDNACGTGIVAQEIVGRDVLSQSPLDPSFKLTVHCTDRSEAMIELTKEHYGGWESANSMRDSFPHVSVNCNVTPAETLPFPDDMFTHSFTNCGILHFDNDLAGARKILRTLKPGATAVVTS